ncbi:MAG: hypothetical protein LBS10_09675 [Gracilibacteraceae bacterium]|nr:hypothetical protein [Gracilibacteraceae bacterium]
MLLICAGVLLSACGAGGTPAENGAPPAETEQTGNPPPGAGGQPPDAVEPEKPPPDEAMTGIKILTFTTDLYSISYPNYWDLEEGVETTGYEVLTFWKKDPDVYEDGGKGVLDPNSAKVSLSLLAKNGDSLNDIALAAIEFSEEDLRSENLDVGGKRAVRYTFSYGEDQVINTYIDWSETEYVWLAGYHGTGSERDTMRRDMLYIHNSLRAAGAEQ